MLNNIHIPPDVPSFLRDRSLISAGFVPRNVSREPDILGRVSCHFGKEHAIRTQRPEFV
ncbi:MAG: hypothetical protein LBF66_01660 [Holosporales bacterium]|nr:hypothetical protein [Holosporales bacterium]